MGSIQMTCEQATMDQEHRFHKELERAAPFRIEEGRLLTAKKDGKDIRRFVSGN